MADISCLADDYYLPVELCRMELDKDAPALNRFVAESFKLTLTTMPYLFEIMWAGVLQTMDNSQIKPPKEKGVQPGRFVSKVPHGAIMCGPTYLSALGT